MSKCFSAVVVMILMVVIFTLHSNLSYIEHVLVVWFPASKHMKSIIFKTHIINVASSFSNSLLLKHACSALVCLGFFWHQMLMFFFSLFVVLLNMQANAIVRENCTLNVGDCQCIFSFSVSLVFFSVCNFN